MSSLFGEWPIMAGIVNPSHLSMQKWAASVGMVLTAHVLPALQLAGQVEVVDDCTLRISQWRYSMQPSSPCLLHGRLQYTGAAVGGSLIHFVVLGRFDSRAPAAHWYTKQSAQNVMVEGFRCDPRHP